MKTNKLCFLWLHALGFVFTMQPETLESSLPDVARYPSKSASLRAQMKGRTGLPRLPYSKGQRKATAERRAKERSDYQKAIAKCIMRIRTDAGTLKAQFDGRRKHSLEYYIEEIIHRSRRQRSKRKTSDWDCFLHHYCKEKNDGEYLVNIPIKK